MTKNEVISAIGDVDRFASVEGYGYTAIAKALLYVGEQAEKMNVSLEKLATFLDKYDEFLDECDSLSNNTDSIEQ